MSKVLKKRGPKGPSKKNESTIRKIIEGHKLDFTIEEVCAYAGISHDTYHRWKNEDRKLSDEIEAAKRFLFLIAKDTTAKGVRDDKDFALKRLSKRQKQIYSDRIEQTGKDGEPLLTDITIKIKRNGDGS